MGMTGDHLALFLSFTLKKTPKKFQAKPVGREIGKVIIESVQQMVAVVRRCKHVNR